MTPPIQLRPRPRKYPRFAPTGRLAAEHPHSRHPGTPPPQNGLQRRLEAVPDPCPLCGGGCPPDVDAAHACRCGSAW